MNDTTTLILGASASFIMAIAIGFLGKRSLRVDILLMLMAGITVSAGYLMLFGNWSETIETQKLWAFFLLTAPGFFIYFFLPLLFGYMVGIFIKEKLKSKD